MRNIEFKAELRLIAAARVQCEQIGAKQVGILEQTDTYFRLTDGRLKRREIPDSPIEWIFYHRQNRIGPRPSNFTILSDEQARHRWGTMSLKPWLTVRKKRDLWLLDNVRIHLDDVERLGTFLEFEAIVDDEHSVADCEKEVARLRELFQPALGEPLSVSYCDLMDQLLETERKPS